MATDLDALIRQREAEAQAEQLKIHEELRMVADRRQRFKALAQNFHLTVTTWVTQFATEFNMKLRASAEIRRQVNETACWITYRKKGGAGNLGEATLTFSIEENNMVTWNSTIGAPQGSASFANVTHPSVRTTVEQFLTAVLAA